MKALMALYFQMLSFHSSCVPRPTHSTGFHEIMSVEHRVLLKLSPTFAIHLGYTFQTYHFGQSK